MKIKVEVEIPDYKIKFCNHCRYLNVYNYGFKFSCILSDKNLNKISYDNKLDQKIHRPYGCRCLTKKCD